MGSRFFAGASTADDDGVRAALTGRSDEAENHLSAGTPAVPLHARDATRAIGVSADARCLPPVELELGQIQHMLAPVLAGAEVVSVERRDDGLVNTVYRVLLAPPQSALALRIYASGIEAAEKERRILERVGGTLA